MSLEYPLIPVPGGYDCPICGDHFTRGRVHKNGEEHPICDSCVHKWDKQLPSPKCAVCRANVKSILSGVEQKEAEHLIMDDIAEAQKPIQEEKEMKDSRYSLMWDYLGENQGKLSFDFKGSRIRAGPDRKTWDEPADAEKNKAMRKLTRAQRS